MPTKVFAEKMAATATVVPKSARESIVLPVDDNGRPMVHVKNGMKKTTAD